MRAVNLRFIINDYLSHAQVYKIKNSQWALAGLPTLSQAKTLKRHGAALSATSTPNLFGPSILETPKHEVK